LYNPSNQKDLVLLLHSSRRQKIQPNRKRFAEPAKQMDCNEKITNRSHHPSKILGELNRASSILETFNDTFTSIQIDDEELYNQTKDYLQEISSKQSIVSFIK
jgi:hypothetical protein